MSAPARKCHQVSFWAGSVAAIRATTATAHVATARSRSRRAGPKGGKASHANVPVGDCLQGGGLRQRVPDLLDAAAGGQAAVAGPGWGAGGVEHVPPVLPADAAGGLRAGGPDSPSGASSPARAAPPVARAGRRLPPAVAAPRRRAAGARPIRPSGCWATWRSRWACRSWCSAATRRSFRAGTRGASAAERDQAYTLYRWSNAGSLLGLLAYPVLVEPALSIGQQQWAWVTLYAGLVVLIAACARATSAAADDRRRARRGRASPRRPLACGRAGWCWPSCRRASRSASPATSRPTLRPCPCCGSCRWRSTCSRSCWPSARAVGSRRPTPHLPSACSRWSSP